MRRPLTSLAERPGCDDAQSSKPCALKLRNETVVEAAGVVASMYPITSGRNIGTRVHVMRPALTARQRTPDAKDRLRLKSNDSGNAAVERHSDEQARLSLKCNEHGGAAIVDMDAQPREANALQPQVVVVRIKTRTRPYSTYRKHMAKSQRLAEQPFSIHAGSPYMSADDVRRADSRIAVAKAKELHAHSWRPGCWSSRAHLPKLSLQLEGFVSGPHEIPFDYPPSFHKEMGSYFPSTLHEFRPHYERVHPMHPRKWRHH